MKSKSAILNQFIPSFVSVGLKFLSGFGLFFLIGKILTEESFSSYVVILSLATFVSTGVNFGYSVKITVDFLKLGVFRSLLESYIIRTIILAFVVAGLAFFGLFKTVPLLFYWIFTSLILGHMLESTSIKLRYVERFWQEVFFTLITTFVPALLSGYLLVEGKTLEDVFFVNTLLKLILFLPLLVASLRKGSVDFDCLVKNFHEAKKFCIDSVLVNFHPFAQIQVAGFFLPPFYLVFFAYGQKMVQGFTVFFIAVNNIFFPKMVKVSKDRRGIKYLLRIFLMIVNIVPVICFILLLVFGVSSLNLLISDAYEEFFSSIYLVLIVVMVRFHAGVLGSALSAIGLQKIRTKINFILMCMELLLMFVVSSLIQSPVLLFLVMMLSSCCALIFYFRVFKNA